MTHKLSPIQTKDWIGQHVRLNFLGHYIFQPNLFLSEDD